MTSYPAVPITCEQFDALFADYLENVLDGRDQANAEAHVSGCARCRGLVSDLVEIRDEAKRLPVLRPTHDLWAGISDRIETPEIHIDERRSSWQARARLAAAAVALVASTAVITWNVARPDAAVTTASADSAGGPGAGISLVSDKVAATYDARISEVRQLLDRRANLDSATLRVLAINLRVIDEAIARVRSALDSMPANAMLSQKLERAYELKLSTLQQFAAMSTE